MSKENGTNGNGARGGRVFGAAMFKPAPCTLQFTVEDVDQHRFLDCDNYDECLDVAVKKKWANFTCEECPVWGFHRRGLLNGNGGGQGES